MWADELNLKLISEYIFNHSNQKKLIGICHGSRNGYEQKKFKELIKNSIVLGLIFQKPLKIMKIVLFGTFMMPKKNGKIILILFILIHWSKLWSQKGLETWINQLNTNGMLFIELSDQHNVQSSGKMDPFGVDPEYFPYLLIDWFKHKISISVLKSIKENKSKAPVWIYVIKKND